MKGSTAGVGGAAAGPSLLSWGGSVGNASAMAPEAWGNSSAAALASDAQGARALMPVAATLRNFRVLLNAAQIAGRDVSYTVRVNGVNTAITCTVPGGVTSASDTVNSVVVAAGDVVEVQVNVVLGTPVNQPTAFSIGVEA